MRYKIKLWDASVWGELSFEGICRFYSKDKLPAFPNAPPVLRSFVVQNSSDNYLVRWNRCEGNNIFSGICKEATYFILSGNCQIKVDEEIYNLKKGNYIYLPNCQFQNRTVGRASVEIVSVFKLNNDFINQ